MSIDTSPTVLPRFCRMNVWSPSCSFDEFAIVEGEGCDEPDEVFDKRSGILSIDMLTAGELACPNIPTTANRVPATKEVRWL